VHEGYSPRLIDHPLFASLHVDVVARSDTLMVPKISLTEFQRFPDGIGSPIYAGTQRGLTRDPEVRRVSRS
jgi:hypothetical protein